MNVSSAMVFAGVAGATIAALALGLLIGGDSGQEDLYPGLRLESPSGEYIAEFFGVGGGGAAGWANQNLRVVEVGTPFEIDSDLVFAARYGYQVCLRWLELNPDSLFVAHRLLARHATDRGVTTRQRTGATRRRST